MIPPQPLATFDMRGRYVTVTWPGFGDDLRLAEVDDLKSARADIYWPLARFTEKFEGGSESESPRSRLDRLTDAIRYLNGEMSRLSFMLAVDRADLVREMQLRFQEAWRRLPHAAGAVPIVEVLGDDRDFPFELVPLFDSGKVGELHNFAEAEDALRRFAAFRVAVRRVSGIQSEPPDLQGGPLSVQYFRYHHEANSIETSYFDEVLPLIRIEGPWPGPDLDPAKAEDLLIDALFDPSGRLDGQERDGDEPPVQVQYFSCHCQTTQSRDGGYTLILGSREKPLTVTLGAIRMGFSERVGRVHSRHRPLIIVNACSSAMIDRHSRASFQRFFTSNWHRGFVGTQSDVGAKDAANFAVLLYQELLDGRPLGEAMVRARRRLLTDRGSPLGLLYVMYGDPLLRIAGPQRPDSQLADARPPF